MQKRVVILLIFVILFTLFLIFFWGLAFFGGDSVWGNEPDSLSYALISTLINFALINHHTPMQSFWIGGLLLSLGYTVAVSFFTHHKIKKIISSRPLVVRSATLLVSLVCFFVSSWTLFALIIHIEEFAWWNFFVEPCPICLGLY